MPNDYKIGKIFVDKYQNLGTKENLNGCLTVIQVIAAKNKFYSSKKLQRSTSVVTQLALRMADIVGSNPDEDGALVPCSQCMQE
jgi:hypothetical protein